MGMPCEVNSILKLKPSQGYPKKIEPEAHHHASKEGYRIFPVDVPIPLVNEDWLAHADVIITKLTWQQGMTKLDFKIDRIYKSPFPVKE